MTPPFSTVKSAVAPALGLSRTVALEQKSAKERQKWDPRSRERVAKAVGWSGSTSEKAKKVAEAARADPNWLGGLPVLMDTPASRNTVGPGHTTAALTPGRP
ncbi:hypothetical protein [Gemmata sp.]|uniref:hypothetical protein n=1 Tax=Gemmata sp. TaxID=1914242 RepID=UPI003F72C4E8